MKILIILLCIVILLHKRKEGFSWKKLKKGASNWAKKAQRALEEARRRAQAAAQRALEEARRRAQAAAECGKLLVNHNKVAAERSMWGQKIKDLRNQASYNDTNFNNKVMYKYFENDMVVLNENINENTRLNTELSKILARIKIYQKNNKQLIDLIKTENTLLKECKMNKELTDNDYDVLN